MKVFNPANKAEFEQYVRLQADIVKVIGEYVPLVRRGRHYIGRCPFHPPGIDKELAVYPIRKSFLCWSSGCSSGSVFDFVAKMNGTTHDESVRLLARSLGISANLFDQLPAERKLVVSFSMLKLFEQCPLRYKYRYVDKKNDQKTTPYLVMGRVVHKTLADFFAAASDDHSLAFLLSKFEKNWKSGGLRTGDQSLEVKAAVEEMLIAYHAVCSFENRTWRVEAPIKCAIGQLAITGIADRIDQLPDGTYEIIDYKTEPMDSSGKNTMQLAFYYYGVMESYHLKASKLTLEYLPSQQAVSIVPCESELSAYVAAACDLVKQIQQTLEFRPTRNAYCADCVLSQNCPETIGR